MKFFSLSVYKYSIIAVLIIIGSGFVISTIPTYAASTCTDTYSPSTAIPTGYGAAYNVFTAAKEMLVKTTSCTDTAASVTIGNGDAGMYVYKDGYYWTGSSWQKIGYTGSSALVSGNWYTGSANGSVAMTSGNSERFYVGYTCQQVSSVWKCGCRDTSCSAAYWQLQKVHKTPNASSGPVCGNAMCEAGETASSCAVDCASNNATTSDRGVVPPQPPSSYTLPSGAVRVANAGQLQTALSGGTKDIILANGTYGVSGTFNAGSHHLWAENLGGATLTSGISFGTGGGLHGMKVDISGGGAKVNDAVVYAEGDNFVVHDSWITGRTNTKYLSGIYAHGNSGVDIRRVVVRNATYNGIMLSDNRTDYTPAQRSYVTDVDVANVADPSPGSLDGTAEAGIWVEHTVNVERAKVRHVSWMGIVTEVNTNDSVFRDLDIDDIYGGDGGTGKGVGFYVEHWTRRTVIEKFYIGPKVSDGFITEWAAPEWNYSAAATDVTLRNGVMDTTRFGAYPDVGNKNTTIENVTFKNQSYAAVIDQGINTVLRNNDYSGIKAGAKIKAAGQGW